LTGTVSSDSFKEDGKSATFSNKKSGLPSNFVTTLNFGLPTAL